MIDKYTPVSAARRLATQITHINKFPTYVPNAGGLAIIQNQALPYLEYIVKLNHKNMIKSATLGRYRIKEFIQFIRNSLMIIDQHGSDKLKIKFQYKKLNQQFQQLKQTYKQENQSEISTKLLELDARRDQAIVCLRMISEGYARHPQPALAAAGAQVLECINKYGTRLYSLNYSAETTVLNNIARDLQASPDCTKAIQDMHLEDVVKEMNKANQEFEKVFIQRLEETSREETQSTRELVQITSEAYRTLTKHIEAHATLTPSVEYLLFIDHLNENIEHFNQIVERRKADAENDGPLVA